MPQPSDAVTPVRSVPSDVPIRSRTPRYSVVIEPDLDLRGRCDVLGRRIRLRRWDEEVFLHESLHALLAEGGYVTAVPDQESGHINVSEEEIVRHISHGLYQIGWRYER